MALDADEPIRIDRPLLELSPDEFRIIGHALIDKLSDYLADLSDLPVSRGESITKIRATLGNSPLPEVGVSPMGLMEMAAGLMLDHSVLSGHPRHLAYIIGSPAPLSALADLLAAMINPNVSSWWRSPMATEIEAQTIRWIAQMVGYPSTCGGILTSGGSTANYIGFLCARKLTIPWDVGKHGLANEHCRPLRIYCSDQTHAWVEKAADIFGLGTEAIRFIPTDNRQRIRLEILQNAIIEDVDHDYIPMMVIGNAGTTATGAVDPLPEMADLCRELSIWFHIDGAYGAFSAILPDSPQELQTIAQADSLALDPHKWLYQPLEAGCALVKDAQLMRDTFTYHPPYYHFPVESGQEPVNYYQYGIQNSRGFRALKVWLSLQQAGLDGYRQMIGDDIKLARLLAHKIRGYKELELFSQNLSITTFRYIPDEFANQTHERNEQLNELNSKLLARLQMGGEVYLSNAIVDGLFLLRACIVNFRTTPADIERIPEIVIRTGREVYETL